MAYHILISGNAINISIPLYIDMYALGPIIHTYSVIFINMCTAEISTWIRIVDWR